MAALAGGRIPRDRPARSGTARSSWASWSRPATCRSAGGLRWRPAATGCAARRQRRVRPLGRAAVVEAVPASAPREACGRRAAAGDGFEVEAEPDEPAAAAGVPRRAPVRPARDPDPGSGARPRRARRITATRRAGPGVFIVAVNCTEPGETCFCTSMGTGPQAGPGYDLRADRAGQPRPRTRSSSRSGSPAGAGDAGRLPAAAGR